MIKALSTKQRGPGEHSEHGGSGGGMAEWCQEPALKESRGGGGWCKGRDKAGVREVGEGAPQPTL